MKLSILLLTAMALLTVPMVVCAADDTPVLVPSLVVGLRHSQNQKPCELGWNFQQFHGGDLGASSGTGFSWKMIPDNPSADPAARNLPAGIVLALKHSTNQSDPRLTAFGHDPVKGPKSLPGFRQQIGGDRGGSSGVGYYWYASTGANTTPEDFAIIDKLPKGTIVGLKHSLNQKGKTFSWHGVTYDAANPKLPAPRGFTRMVGGDLKAPANQGYYWYQKVECPCSSGVGVGTCWSNGADPFDQMPESIDDAAKALAVVFDFDTDSCYPSPAVSRLGQQNGGLKTSGPMTGQCREKVQLNNSNTYYRKKCISKEGVAYCVHMYALYFMKDQTEFSSVGGGHRQRSD